MALNFAPNPSNGDYDSTGKWQFSSTPSPGVWKAVSNQKSVVIPSATPPANPVNGNLWYNTNDGTLYIYYTDQDGSQWVEVKANSGLGATLGARVDALEAKSQNYIINGGMDIWQRGTSWANITGIYGPDRWKITRNGAGTNWTGSRVAASTSGFQYALRMQRASGTSGVDPLFVGHALETAEVIKMQGKTVTVSYYLRAGANLSSSVSFYLASGTGTDEQAFAGLTGEIALVSESYSLSTSMTRYSKTFTVPANATSMRFNVAYTPTGTAGANDYFDVTGVQLEEGSVATTFRRNANSIQGELAACQRYYQTGGDGAMGIMNSAVECRFAVKWTVPMRTNPTIKTKLTVYALNPTVSEAQASSTAIGSTLVSVANGSLTIQGVSKLSITGFSSGADGRAMMLLGDCLSIDAEL